MLLRDPELKVFHLDDQGSFDLVGEINQFTSLLWPDAFAGYSTFELYAPITEENNLYLREGYVLWNGGDNAAVIEIKQAVKNDRGEKIYQVKGRTLESLLTTRILWGKYIATNKFPSTMMYELVTQNCINPNIPQRKIPFLECAEDEELGQPISLQKTGGELYDTLQELAHNSDLGFNVVFRPKEKKLVFKVYAGTDRSVIPTQAGDPVPVVLSTDLEDILSSSYYKNTQDEKNLAYVAGELVDDTRTIQLSGDNTLYGFSRKELYVDAKDLQSTGMLEDGTQITLTKEEYLSILSNRGNERLSEHSTTETFEVQVRTSGGQYTYGVDYFKGDKILARDSELGVEVVARITEVSQAYGENAKELLLTFGYAFPTLIQRIKKQIST